MPNRTPELPTHSRLVLWALAAGLTAVTVVSPAPADTGRPPDQPRHCARCDGAIVEKLEVVVTDFPSRKEFLYCGVACALRDMAEKFPTARAVAHDPFAGKEVRIIRTGVRWVAWPKSVVFLYLPEAQDLDPPQRCLAFPRQDEYIQYLATHSEVAAHNPRPLPLTNLLAALNKPRKGESGPA